MKKTNEIVKPVTLIVEDLQNEILDKINESHLPYFIIETVLEKLLVGARNAAEQQLNADREQYNKAMEKVKQDESK